VQRFQQQLQAGQPLLTVPGDEDPDDGLAGALARR
jgi:hypothetical protein